MKELKIVKARPVDSRLLTEIAFAAKRHWGYPDGYFELWKDELTITEEYVQKHIVYTSVFEGKTAGFYSVVDNASDIYAGEVFVKQGFWLEHIFIKPGYHKMGIGSLLIDHMRSVCEEQRIGEVHVFVDPNARGFYDKTGAVFQYDSKSSIPGRLIPVYRFSL